MHDKGIGPNSRPIVDTTDGPEQAMADDRLTWAVPEAAHLLSISKDSAYEAARRGELPVKIIGRRMLVPHGALLRVLDEAHVFERRDSASQ